MALLPPDVMGSKNNSSHTEAITVSSTYVETQLTYFRASSDPTGFTLLFWLEEVIRRAVLTFLHTYGMVLVLWDMSCWFGIAFRHYHERKAALPDVILPTLNPAGRYSP